MKKQHVDYRPEKARFGEYLAMFQGIKMPWLFIILIFVATVCSTFAALNISMFTGDMVDANGRVPAAQLAAFALSYLLVGLCTAGSAIFQGVASERINWVCGKSCGGRSFIPSRAVMMRTAGKLWSAVSPRTATTPASS